MSADRWPPKPIRVAVVSDTGPAAEHISSAMREADPALRLFILPLQSAHQGIRELRPDVALLRLGPRGGRRAENVGEIANGHPCGVVLLTPASLPWDAVHISQTGALVHLIEPLPAQALVAAVHIAAARGEECRRLRREVSSLRERTAARTVVERAKAVLMSRLTLSEEEAHRRLQIESRNRNRRLVDTAWHVIRADQTLPRQGRGGALDTPTTHPR